jgi:hypothetical protein
MKDDIALTGLVEERQLLLKWTCDQGQVLHDLIQTADIQRTQEKLLKFPLLALWYHPSLGLAVKNAVGQSHCLKSPKLFNSMVYAWSAGLKAIETDCTSIWQLPQLQGIKSLKYDAQSVQILASAYSYLQDQKLLIDQLLEQVRTGRKASAQELISGINPIVLLYGWSGAWLALRIAAQRGDSAMVDMLMDSAGEDFDWSTQPAGDFADTPLDIAAECDHYEIALRLLSEGVWHAKPVDPSKLAQRRKVQLDAVVPQVEVRTESIAACARCGKPHTGACRL